MLIKSPIEIIPSERGRKWIVLKSFTANYLGETITIPKGFVYDRYTIVPNLPDPLPACVHDYIGITQKYDTGKRITYSDWCNILFHFMRYSGSIITRALARLYFYGVKYFSWPYFLYYKYFPQKPEIKEGVT